MNIIIVYILNPKPKKKESIAQVFLRGKRPHEGEGDLIFYLTIGEKHGKWFATCRSMESIVFFI